jgi:hypothetical protein
MKVLRVLFAGAVLCSLLNAVNFTFAQGTAFTYQGRLTDNASPAGGAYDLTFAVFDAASIGSQVGATLTNAAVAVSNGLFTVTLDFGVGVFTGDPRWLEIGVATNGSGSFATLSPRQALLPTPYAIFANTASNVVLGSVVTSLNALKDDVTLSAGSNVTITPSGNTLTIDSVGAGGSGIWNVNGADTYFDTGNVAIGTNSPFPGYRLDVNGATLLRPGGNGGGFIGFGTPNFETGMTINGGAGRADLRFDGSTVKLLAGPAGGPPSAAGGIAISTNGLVGVGILPNPASGIRLDVNGQAILRTGGNGGGIVQFGSPNAETGMTINGNNRADLRFNGSTLKLVAGPGNSIPSSANGIAIDIAGNVGMGTDAPLSKLDVRGTTRTCVLTITGGCDLAEPFPMDASAAPKGSVVVIDNEHPGQLKLSDRAYDTRVAGIVSGANGINAGISLQQEGALEGGQNVALSGRVYAQADAAFGAINPGDLLTTSSTPGHAMKVTDHAKSQGAILGKAMSNLKEGKGMVLVLVTLQ